MKKYFTEKSFSLLHVIVILVVVNVVTEIVPAVYKQATSQQAEVK